MAEVSRGSVQRDLDLAAAVEEARALRAEVEQRKADLDR